MTTEISAQSNPIDVFGHWMAEAKSHPGIREATAAALATVNSKGELHNRVVLCKDHSEAGFTFFTNYDSRKGHDLAEHPQAAMVLYWDPMARQVKISGRVEKVAREVSEAYWASRPRESQLSQWISRQSEPVGSREELENQWRSAEREFEGRKIPCPKHWGGYLLSPRTIEFWVGRPGRLHDRFEFIKSGSIWTFRRLCP
ncbi:MAG: pyridoxamine 5'-phosphate oxidase [Bdellovibrionales bacterium]